LLVDRGADIEGRGFEGRTPLHEAALCGQLEVARFLIDKGAKIESRDENKCTPLNLAAFDGRLSVAQLLVENGADIDGRGSKGRTPLLEAAFNGQLEVARFLLEKGADIEGKDNQQNTPLILAASEGHLSVAQLLAERGANFEGMDLDDLTSLLNAAPDGQLQLDVERFSLESGADINLENGVDISGKDLQEDTPLIVAVSEGQLSVVTQLIMENGADIEGRGVDDRTPLLNAALNGQLDIARFLLEKGADIEGRDHQKNTPLILFASEGHRSVVELLVEKGTSSALPAITLSTRIDALLDQDFVTSEQFEDLDKELLKFLCSADLTCPKCNKVDRLTNKGAGGIVSSRGTHKRFLLCPNCKARSGSLLFFQAPERHILDIPNLFARWEKIQNRIPRTALGPRSAASPVPMAGSSTTKPAPKASAQTSLNKFSFGSSTPPNPAMDVDARRPSKKTSETTNPPRGASAMSHNDGISPPAPDKGKTPILEDPALEEFCNAIEDKDLDACVNMFQQERHNLRTMLEESHSVNASLRASLEDLRSEFELLKTQRTAPPAPLSPRWADMIDDDEPLPPPPSTSALESRLSKLEEAVAQLPSMAKLESSIDSRIASSFAQFEDRILKVLANHISPAHGKSANLTAPLSSSSAPAPTAASAPSSTPTYADAVRKMTSGVAMSPAELRRIALQHKYSRPAADARYVNIFARLSIPKELPRNRYLDVARNILNALGINDGVAFISFVGRSVMHLVVEEQVSDNIVRILSKDDAYLPNFDITGYPDHCTTETQRTAYRTRTRPIFMKRMAILLSSTTGGRRACIRSLIPEALVDQVEDMAADHLHARQEYLDRLANPLPLRPLSAPMDHQDESFPNDSLFMETDTTAPSTAKRTRNISSDSEEDTSAQPRTRPHSTQ
ncbi:hypothetical protein HDU96_002510, partial [Phlyctochytrium bullatum]